MIRNSVKRFSEKIMHNQKANLISPRFKRHRRDSLRNSITDGSAVGVRTHSAD